MGWRSERDANGWSADLDAAPRWRFREMKKPLGRKRLCIFCCNCSILFDCGARLELDPAKEPGDYYVTLINRTMWLRDKLIPFAFTATSRKIAVTSLYIAEPSSTN